MHIFSTPKKAQIITDAWPVDCGNDRLWELDEHVEHLFIVLPLIGAIYSKFIVSWVFFTDNVNVDLKDQSPDNSLKLTRSLAPQKFRKAGNYSREYSSFIVLLVAFANTCRQHSDTCQPPCISQPEFIHFKYCSYRTAFRFYLGVWVLSSLLELEIEPMNRFCSFFRSC